MKAGSRAFIFFTPDSGLIDALFARLDGWKMATIAEFLFIRPFRGHWFSGVAVKWKNVYFFALINRGGIWILLAFCALLTQPHSRQGSTASQAIF
jgi:hypothetical protein